MRIVLTGASGQLGGFVAEALTAAGHEVIGWSGRTEGERSGVVLRPVDLADLKAVEVALNAADPSAVIHAGAASTIDGVWRDPDRARAVNVRATEFLAEWCGHHGRRLIYTSTDLVFDGIKGHYSESDAPTPVMLYGRTKLDAEAAVVAAGGLVARMSLMYGPSRGGAPTFFDRTATALQRGEPQTFFEDEFRTPLDLPTAATALTMLVTSDTAGLLHLGGAERLSRFELARRWAQGLGLDPALILANRQSDVSFNEPRPADVSLDTARLTTVLPALHRPSVEEAVSAMSSR